ncbi:TetR family transcriptional regulator [Kitasatospora sp. NPDC058965]|uniref:TetR family transcriptional regulator n=1 Tax=Kitasatospora sp. NPDC058965 TaxID=3346682 RepID=UPI0036C5BAD3
MTGRSTGEAGRVGGNDRTVGGTVAVTEPELRRRPVQQRSQQRLERILDACAELLDEHGATALTTKEIAARAQVPIGTLYQFFTGKQSLLAALARRNLSRYLDRLTRRLAAESPQDVGGFVDLAVEEFVAMKRAVPGFGALDFGLTGPTPPALDDVEHLLDLDLDNNSAVAALLHRLTSEHLTDEGRPPGPLALRVALECADAVLKLAFQHDKDGDPALIAECKVLLRRYLG